MTLKLKDEGMKALHFFVKPLDFPVAIGSYSDEQEAFVSVLKQNFNSLSYTTEDLCQWCVNHHIPYQILYPIKTERIFQDPLKYIRFLRLKKRIAPLSLDGIG